MELHGEPSSVRADRHAARRQAPRGSPARRCERAGRGGQHAASQRRIARRQRDDSVPRFQGSQRQSRQSEGPDGRGHGERSDAADPAVSTDRGAAVEVGCPGPETVRLLLIVVDRYDLPRKHEIAKQTARSGVRRRHRHATAPLGSDPFKIAALAKGI